VKPPVQFSVKADETPFKSASDDSGALLPPLAVGTVVESVDGQKIGEQTRVMTDGQDGWVEESVLEELAEKPPAEWAAPLPSIAEVNCEIKLGELVLVSGPVAGGKSTLLESLVGNTEKLAGTLQVPSIAFQPQTPILFDTTIRGNVWAAQGI
jgi:ABC-type multidrug transport system fused ATPase/permease subunit